MRGPLRTLVIGCAAVIIAACGSHGPPPHDCALIVGPLAIGDAEAHAIGIVGAGTRGHWRDERGERRDVRIYRSDGALLALAFADGRLIDIEAYAHVAPTVAHGIFDFSAARMAAVAGRPVASYAWLGEPVFSDALPTPPAGWHLPTDFTVTQQDVPFIITSDDRSHLASKQRSRSFGWAVSVH